MKSQNANIRPALYRYNSDTCAYEPSPRSIAFILSYILLVFSTATALLIGMLFLHDYLVETDNEITLKKENAAIKRYYTILSNELDQVNQSLSNLEEKDKRLHEKFFNVPLAKSESKKDTRINLLVANHAQSEKATYELKTRTQQLLTRAQRVTSLPASSVSNLSRVASSLPVLTPIENIDPSLVLSGFGLRINPFHKALYQHQGIDIAVPRGTSVRVTGAGQVLTVKQSNLLAGFGNYIEVDHGDNIITRYTHLDEIFVKQGQKLQRGQRIGLSGNSGGSVAPHLHYEILRNGVNINPIGHMLLEVTPELSMLLAQVSSIENQALD